MRDLLLSAEAARLLAVSASATTGEGPLADVVESAERMAEALYELAERMADADLHAAGVSLAERCAFAGLELARLRASEASQDLRAVAQRDLSPQVGNLVCALLDEQGRPRGRTVEDLLPELWPGEAARGRGNKTVRRRLLGRFRDLLRRTKRELLAKYDSPVGGLCICRPTRSVVALGPKA